MTQHTIQIIYDDVTHDFGIAGAPQDKVIASGMLEVAKAIIFNPPKQTSPIIGANGIKLPPGVKLG